MTAKLPEDFLCLEDTGSRADQEVNVVGVIVDFLPPTKTRGSDWQLSLGILDPSYLSSMNARSGLRVKFFKQEPQLPKISGIGDVIILRKIKRSFFGGTPILVSTWNTSATVFPASTIPEKSFKAAYGFEHLVIPHTTNPGQPRRPTDQEQLYIMDLQSWAKDYLDLSPTSIPTGPQANHSNLSAQRNPSKPGNKFRLLKDITDGRGFYDLVGEVVKVWKSSSYTTLYWTDYTSNKKVQPIKTKDGVAGDLRDGDEYGYTKDIKTRKEWSGPSGQLVLQIFLWPPHSDWANNNLTDNDFVLIRNVRVGLRDGEPYYRADLNPDDKHPDQIDIRKVSNHDPRCQEMIIRREKYWVDREKPEKKKLSKRQKKRLREEAERTEELPLKKPFKPKENNGNVACGFPERPLLPVANVVDTPYLDCTGPARSSIKLPFVNQRCRIRVRVVDFWPDELEDFSRLITEDPVNETQADSEEYSMGSKSRPMWEWAFGLLVEDASTPPPGQKPARMPLIVSEKDAEYLLKLDATDLRKNPRALSELKEKLFILWGNLLETKKADRSEEKLSNKAFECCIQEYGVRTTDGWLRLHKIFKTTIH